MYVRRFLVLLSATVGASLGAALTSGMAVADPIDDAWPYGVPLGSPPYLPGYGALLPGFPDTRSITNFEQQNFGPLTWTQSDYDSLHGGGGSDWYTVHDNTFIIPSLLDNDQQTVQALLDSTATFPHVGTVADQFQLFPIGAPAISDVWLIQSFSLDDPDLGSASAFYFFPGLVNTYISDDAGIKDIVNFFGQSFTLFEIPFTTASGAEASDAGDGFSQLLAELTGTAPGAADLL